MGEETKAFVNVLGDEQRIVVKNLIRDLIGKNFEVCVTPLSMERLQRLPLVRQHLIFCPSDSTGFPIIQELASRRKQSELYLYIAGKPKGLSIDEENFLKRIPGYHFATLPVDMQVLEDAIATNERKKKRILVVDDEPIMLRNINSWLGGEYELFLVNSGDAAIDFLFNQKVDLILLDYMMPTMSGVELLRSLRASWDTKSIPVIFLTGKNDRNTVMDAVQQKPDGYILKSQPPEELRTTVANFFRNRVVTV